MSVAGGDGGGGGRKERQVPLVADFYDRFLMYELKRREEN